ncbi:MAG: DUF5329 domain-containing protein [Pseudomonadota bacterium]
MKFFFFSILLLMSSYTLAQHPQSSPDQEIQHLLSYLESSNCKFSRNGTWYSSTEAKAHLSRKYNYLQKKDLAPTAEIFIKRAASESSSTGKPYFVQCEGKASIPSAEWLTQELTVYRK